MARRKREGTTAGCVHEAGRVVFRRHVSDKVAGAIVYLIAGPFFGGLLGVIFGLLAFGLLYATFHLSEEHAGQGGVVVAGLGVVVGLVWAYREFRRRSSTQLFIEKDAIEYVVGRKSIRCTIEEISGVRLANAGKQVVIDRENGAAIRVPTEFLGARQLMPHLRNGPLIGVAARHEASVTSGGSIEVRDVGLLAIPLAGREVLRLMLGLICLPGLHLAMEGVKNISVALAGIRYCVRGLRGGFVVTREGLGDVRDPTQRLSWGRVSRVRVDSSGLRIEGDQGGAFTASPYAEHYCDVCVMLERRGLLQREGARA